VSRADSPCCARFAFALPRKNNPFSTSKSSALANSQVQIAGAWFALHKNRAHVEFEPSAAVRVREALDSAGIDMGRIWRCLNLQRPALPSKVHGP
jgi:hypothetical protein